MKKPLIVIGTIVLAAVAFIGGSRLYQQSQTSERAGLTSSRSANLVRPHSPIFGSESAKVTIVEFLDPACETCGAMAPLVKSLVTASFGQVRLVVRYAPLHQGSDQIVRILEAARLQGKYWQALEAVLASQSMWASHDNPRPELVWNIIGTAGVDIAQAKADLQNPKITEALRLDREDLVALKVTKTPEFFVNGKPLPQFGPEQLKALVKSETRAAYGQ
ncbi:DsbA family protein [Methyloversatilis discipulorum]|uniref:DsbA family protein n=1 Tax=Methyloversatilis discipulorum TaxID=1119528 RepID=UPI003F350E48